MSPARPDPVEARRREATRLGLFAALRRQERRNPDRPPVGRNARLADEVAVLGQDPSLDFPAADVTDFERLADGRISVRTAVLGYFGPQGALPLNTTEEVLRWSVAAGDESFPRFADVFATRFLQLFFRAWSDARAVGQFDHPDRDRFRAHVAALSGISTPAFRDRDGIPEISRTRLVGLHATRVRSAVRLRQLIELYLRAEVEVEEHVPTWIVFEPEDRSRLGLGAATLGRDAALGSRTRSVNDRIRLHIRTRGLEDYHAYLPGGLRHRQLADLVFWFLGRRTEVEVALSLPAETVPPGALGKTMALGWMAALAPDEDATGPIEVARFELDAA
ncbi:type VI secretion system baseplate subunit TssG [Jannaschia sp. Os4]|uniref:type VI secretion system baseplate subunit TssG n=1 Tax=Jannaschia sp. Os4 TaxID=2807617 RepID=UPI00193A7DC5|nr:type VI secretion system baseplate subunit TssG [Jannaschia sp. Os4]